MGSSPDTTAGAAISSPDASATPVTAPSRVVTATTFDPVRISAPAARAADASASDTADGPPFAKTVSPAAPPSLPAESASSTAVEPADQGPMAVYRTARQAAVARIGSLSNDSATKSAAAIASTRRIVRPSCLPRPRNARPRRRPRSASPKPGPAMSGGASSPRSARNRDSERTRRSYSTKAVASSSENWRRASTLLARSVYSVTARPSAWGAKTRTSGATRASPWLPRSSSRTTAGRSRPTVWASDGTRAPPRSSVTAAPPTIPRASRTRTRSPALAMYAAAVRPL